MISRRATNAPSGMPPPNALAGLGTRFPLYINDLIVQLDIAQTFHRILAVMAGNDIRSGDGHRQLTAIISKVP